MAAPMSDLQAGLTLAIAIQSSILLSDIENYGS
jgi:hypothetical protein